MLVLSVLILNSFCLFSVTCLEVELVLEYETIEYKSTVMQCKFDLEGATLGNIVWEKNGEKFFEYNRRRVPHTTVSPVDGISLDEEKSNVTHVFLTNLKPESSGEYSCLVSTSGAGVAAAIARENMTTSAKEPISLLVATRRGFYLITTQNYSHAVRTEDSHPVLSVDYHYYDGTIFYGKDTIIHQDFYESENDSRALPHLGGALILAEEGEVTSIAVDWLRYTLYFTDDLLDNIGMVNLTSENRKTLVDGSQGVSTPESIVVDPFQGYLFWGDNSKENMKIVSSALDGQTNRQTIVTSGLLKAILALDLDRRRLFFISNEGLSSCKYDGSAIRLVFTHQMLDSNVNSLSYHDDFVFWSRHDTGKSSSGLFYARITSLESPVKELPIQSILDVKVFHPDMQKRSLKYTCSLLECSHGCTPDETGSAECTCPPGHTLTAGATVCVKEQTKICKESLTIVNSVPACKGDTVFEENFESNVLDHDKWQNTVQISSDHEMEFVTYSKDSKNIYIEKGNLVIKPTLLDDNMVSSGNISLIGCTTPVTHLCEKQAFSYSILPPVRSALINTAHAFNFRYGVVTVRAKLPRGDWIYPVLKLQATKDYYSPNYRSGVIHIVDVRGNEQLICEGQEFGVKNLGSGVVVGQQQNVKKQFIYKQSDQQWSDMFHNFTFTWTPDNLSFSIDGESSENILPEGKTLREALELQKEDGRSRVDPFNSDVYLSVGVSVGGVLEFPDNCASGSGQQGMEGKPWRNSEVKSMLKFWQKQSVWSSTWGEHSALVIDYVSVQAL